MIPFMEKTWLLWWMLAIVVVMRWFHLLQTTAKSEGFDAPAPVPQESRSNSGSEVATAKPTQSFTPRRSLLCKH